MTCSDFQRLLQCQLDGEPIADRAALDAHLAACSACQLQWTAATQLAAGLRLTRPVPVAPEISGRIVTRVLAQQRAARRLRRGLAIVGAMAAAILVTIFLVRFWPQAGDTPMRPGGSPVVKETPPPVKEIPAEVPSLRESITQVAQLTLRKADDTVGEARSLLARPLANDAPPAPMNSMPPTQTLREAGSGITAGLEPVADSAKRAWNLFLREIPSVRPADKRGA